MFRKIKKLIIIMIPITLGSCSNETYNSINDSNSNDYNSLIDSNSSNYNSESISNNSNSSTSSKDYCDDYFPIYDSNKSYGMTLPKGAGAGFNFLFGYQLNKSIEINKEKITIDYYIGRRNLVDEIKINDTYYSYNNLDEFEFYIKTSIYDRKNKNYIDLNLDKYNINDFFTNNYFIYNYQYDSRCEGVIIDGGGYFILPNYPITIELELNKLLENKYKEENYYIVNSVVAENIKTNNIYDTEFESVILYYEKDINNTSINFYGYDINKYRNTTPPNPGWTVKKETI